MAWQGEVDYWFDKGGIEKLVAQYPKLFNEDVMLYTMVVQYNALEAQIVARTTAIIEEDADEPD